MSSTTIDLRAEATALYTPEYRASILIPDPPPPGVDATVDFNSSNTYGTFYIVFAVIAFFLSFTFTVMRFYTKAVLTRALGWDDYTCGAAVALIFIWTITSTRMAVLGMGRHAWDIRITVAAHEEYAKMNFIGSSVYSWALCLIKVSILALYLRTFSAPGKFRKTLWIILTIVIMTQIVVIPLYWLTALPLSCKWRYATLPFDLWSVFCHNNYSDTPYWMFMAVLTIFLDIIVITLPCRAVWKLHMVKRQKIAVIMIIMAGGVVTLMSTVRFVYLYQDIYLGANEQGVDGPYGDFPIYIFSDIELNLAVICACLPTLKTFIRRFVPRLLKLPPTDAYAPSSARKTKRSIPRPFNNFRGTDRSGSEQAVTSEICDATYQELGDAKSDQSYAMTTKLVDSRSTLVRTS